MPKTTPLSIAEFPAPKAKRGRPRKSEVRPPIPLSNGGRLVRRKQQAALLGVCERTLVRLRVPTTIFGGVAYVQTARRVRSLLMRSATRSHDEFGGRRDDEPDESIDYLNRLEGPIVEALAAREAGRLPHAIKVGEAFLAAKNIVVKDGIKRNTGRKGDNWSNWRWCAVIGGLVGGFRHMLYPFEATLCDFLLM